MPKRENTSEASAHVRRAGVHVRSFALGALVACILALGVALMGWLREPVTPLRIGDNSAGEARNSPAERRASELERMPATAEVSTSAREPVGYEGLSPSELRRALASATTRLEQIQVIMALLEIGSTEAMQVLLDRFLASDDKVLLALLEEALLESPEEMVPSLLAAFQAAQDPAKLDGLANILRQVASKDPELTKQLVASLLQSLEEPDGMRADSAARALQALGPSAVEQLAARLREPGCTPEAAGSVAAILSKMPQECAELLRTTVTLGFDSMRDVLSDPYADAADKDLARKKTGSLVWAASSRAPSEQDSLAPVLADQLGRAADPEQAGTLAWGIGEMHGLSDAGRAQAALVLFDALAEQPNGNIRQIMGRSLVQLVKAGVSGSYDAVASMIASAKVGEQDPAIVAQLDQMLADLESGRRSGH